MTMDHIDGNGMAGLLAELLGAEPTGVLRTCHACGDEQPLAAHRAYRGAGVTLRCPSCEVLAIRIGMHGDHRTVELHGRLSVSVPAAASS